MPVPGGSRSCTGGPSSRYQDEAAATNREADAGLAQVDCQAKQELDATAGSESPRGIHRHYGESPLAFAPGGGTRTSDCL